MRMSSGEKMVWAASYAMELRRLTLGLEVGRRLDLSEAAGHAARYAGDAVAAARAAVGSSCLSDAADQSMLSQVLGGSR